MSKKSTNHVIPSSSRWAVKKSSASKASRIFDSKDKAVRYGRDLSKVEKTALYIHKKNGMVEEKNHLRNDPNESIEKTNEL